MIDKELLRLSEYKKIRYITDVDLSIERFENNFLNTYANLLPKETAVEKSLLIKNILPLYLSKGSEKSFKYLFRLLFDEEVKVSYLRDNILRASASRWVKENSINIDATKIYSVYDCDGDVKSFDILGNFDKTQIQVFENDSLANTADYDVYKEYKKVIFHSPPYSANTIKVLYNTIDNQVFNSRKITGVVSGATALIEKTSFQLINGRLTLKLFVDNKSVDGEFAIGEELKTDVVINDNLVNISLVTISELKSINIIDGGSSYNVGDPAIVISPGAKRDAVAIVSKVFYPTIEEINLVDGGAGFKSGGTITADGIGEPLVNIKVATVSSQRTASNFTIFSDVISDIDPANTLISATDYFLSVPNTNLSSNLYTSFSDITYTNIGEIIAIEINSIEVPFIQEPIIDALPTTITIPNIGYTTTQTDVRIDTFGSLGKIVVHDGGINYRVGDEIILNKKPGCLGIGAEAEVKRVNSAGSIVEALFVPAKISGTANLNLYTTGTHVIGTGTKFTEELKVGDKIMINFEERIVSDISSDISMNVSSAFNIPFQNKKVRLVEKYLLGGQGYTQNKLPTISIVSANGSNANLEVTCLMGTGDIIAANTTPLNGRKIGAIEQIKIVDSGDRFITFPEIDLSGSGAGNAKAQAVLYPTYQTYDGKWITTDSLVSHIDRRLQGLNYYINYAYLLSSPVQLVKYKSVVKDLLHPAGYISYSELTKTKNIVSANISVESVVTINAGAFASALFDINVANSSILWGLNVANFDIQANVSSLVYNTFDIEIGNSQIITATDVSSVSFNVGNSFIISSESVSQYGTNVNSIYNIAYSDNVSNLTFNIANTFVIATANVANLSVNVNVNTQTYIAFTNNAAFSFDTVSMPISLNVTPSILHTENINDMPVLIGSGTPIFYTENVAQFSNVSTNFESGIFYTENVAQFSNVSTNLESGIFYTENVATANIGIGGSLSFLQTYLDANNSTSYPGTGNTWFDLSENLNDGTINGATYSSANGGIFVFDGVNDEVTTTKRITTTMSFSYTMAGWFKTSSASGKKIVGFENNQTGTGSTSHERVVYVNTSGKLVFGVWFGSTFYITSAQNVDDGNWYHFAVTATRQTSGTFTYEMFINGTSVGTVSGTPVDNNAVYMRIGSYRINGWAGASDGYFPGSIASIRFYDRYALTSAQIQSIFDSEKTRFGL